MAEIWQGYEIQREATAGSTVAVKLPLRETLDDPRRRSRFLREIDILRQLRHANVVEYVDDGVIDGVPFLVTELLVGCTLRVQWERWRARGLTFRAVFDVVSAVAQAVQVLQESHIVHLDLCLDNIFITSAGTVKILDFGSAVEVAEPVMDMTGEVLTGKRGRVAPEVRLRTQVAANTDVFSLGVILYELLTGGVPFGEDDTDVAARRAEKGEYSRPVELNPVLNKVEDLRLFFDNTLIRSAVRSDIKHFCRMLQAARVEGGLDTLVFPVGDPPPPPSPKRTTTEETAPPPKKAVWPFLAAGGCLVLSALMLVVVFAIIPVVRRAVDNRPTFDDRAGGGGGLAKELKEAGDLVSRGQGYERVVDIVFDVRTNHPGWLSSLANRNMIDGWMYNACRPYFQDRYEQAKSQGNWQDAMHAALYVVKGCEAGADRRKAILAFSQDYAAKYGEDAAQRMLQDARDGDWALLRADIDAVLR